MSEHKIHLENAISQQKELISEIEELNRQINIKREGAIKLQGIIEYISSLEKSSVSSVDFEEDSSS
jgi:hypothetical protein